MKHISVIYMLLLCSIASAFAQRPFMRDTIIHREPTYFYQFWLDSADIKYYYSTDSCNMTLDSNTVCYETAKYNYTDSTLKVVGVAAAVFSRRMDLWAVLDNTYDNWFEYMRLYKHTDTGMTVLAEQTFTVLDTARWMMSYKATNKGVVGRALPIFEVFFDQPVTVTDSFYVSVSNHHLYTPHGSSRSIGNWALPGCYNSAINSERMVALTHCTNQDNMYLSRFDSLWYNIQDDHLFFIFPIIDTTQPLPDTCAAVTHLVADAADSTTQLLSWVRGRYNLAWEVACGPADSSAAWSIQQCSTTSATLTGLVHGREYAACVRALCADSVHYSDWGDTIRFLAGHTEGIRHAAPPLGFTLSPNPASGEVTIQGLGEVPQTIEVLDMTGRTAASFRRTSAIDISALPAGSYIVRVQTSQGSGTQKLMVN